MTQIDLEDRLGAQAPVLLRQDALELAARALAVGNEAGGRAGEARRGLDVADALAERGLDHGNGGGLVGGRLVLLRLVRLVDARDQVEIEIALAQRLQRLALELRRHRGPEGVDGIGQQQHLDAARGCRLEPRIGLQPLDAVADEIVDLGLVRLEIGDDLLQRTLLARRRGEARQGQQLFAPLEILVDAFLEDRTEPVPDLGKIVRILVGEAFELRHDPGRHRLADLRQLRIVLQHLAGDVEREILAVDDAADEAQIARQQIGIIGDEDPANVKLHAALAVRLEQVERLGRGREQQHGVGIAPLGTIMQRHRGIVEGGCDLLIGLLVVLARQLGLRALPQRARRIDLARLAFFRHELDGEQDVVGIGMNDALNLEGLEIFPGIVLQVQDDLGASRHAGRLLVAGAGDLEAGAAGGSPGPDIALAGAAADHDDLLGDHEGGIEADAELADQAEAVLGLLQLGHERLGAGAGDGAEMIDQLLPLHADAVVGDHERFGLLVRGDADLERVALAQQRRAGNRLVAELVAGVGGVGDELAQEDVGLGIDGVHHEVQQLGNLGLEGLRMHSRV